MFVLLFAILHVFIGFTSWYSLYNILYVHRFYKLHSKGLVEVISMMVPRKVSNEKQVICF